MSDVAVTPEVAAAADDAAPETAPSNNKPVMRRFRKAIVGERLSPDQQRRQGHVSSLAWQRLGGRDAAVAFLNTHHEALDARPLDLAIASDEGLARVEALLPAA